MWSLTPTPTVIAGKESINLSITNTLFAAAFNGGTAEIGKDSAVLTVGLAVIPIPPAIWMMGAAMAALVSMTVGRRNS